MKNILKLNRINAKFFQHFFKIFSKISLTFKYVCLSLLDSSLNFLKILKISQSLYKQILKIYQQIFLIYLKII